MSTPLISICLPNLNTRPFLEARMESLLQQTVADWELIVCDSYSSDGSWEFFQKFATDRRIHLHQVPKAGVYAGWNECLKRATGEFVYIATSDDTAQPLLLEKLLAPLQKHADIHLALCQVERIDEQGRSLPTKPQPATEVLGEWSQRRCVRNGKAEFILHAVLGTIWTSITTVLMRRSLLDRTGFFRTDLRSFADNEFAQRASLASDIAFVPEPLATWRIHAGQVTPKASTWAEFELFCRSLQSVLDDPAAGIPEAWKNIPQWQEKLLRTKHLEALEYLRLFRWELKKDPARFFQHVLLALRNEPLWLAQQTLRGFGWPKVLDQQPVTTVRQLLSEFQAPWPPRSADANWNLS